jgi:hypothetical protein
MECVNGDFMCFEARLLSEGVERQFDCGSWIRTLLKVEIELRQANGAKRPLGDKNRLTARDMRRNGGVFTWRSRVRSDQSEDQ